MASTDCMGLQLIFSSIIQYYTLTSPPETTSQDGICSMRLQQCWLSQVKHGAEMLWSHNWSHPKCANDFRRHYTSHLDYIYGTFILHFCPLWSLTGPVLRHTGHSANHTKVITLYMLALPISSFAVSYIALWCSVVQGKGEICMCGRSFKWVPIHYCTEEPFQSKEHPKIGHSSRHQH